MTRGGASLASWLCLALAVGPGCKKDDPPPRASASPQAAPTCVDLAERRTECFSELAGTEKATLVAECESRAPEPGYGETIACVRADDCAAFEACLEEVRAQFRAQRQQARLARKAVELQDHVTASRWREANAMCRLLKDELDGHDTLGELCEEARRGGYESLRAALESVRDELRTDSETFGLCLDLKDAAAVVGPEAVPGAEKLCLEAGAVEHVVRAHAAIEAAVAKGEARVPFECGTALSRLGELTGSAWAAAQRRDVTQKCHVELPKRLMEPAMASLAQARDSGELGDALTRCWTLERMVEDWPEAERKPTATLCGELRQVANVARADELLDTAIAGRKDMLPYPCTSTLTSLSKLDSDWSRKTAARLAQRCFVDLGRFVLAARVPKMRYVCDFNVRRVMEGLARYRISSPALDVLVARAHSTRLCER